MTPICASSLAARVAHLRLIVIFRAMATEVQEISAEDLKSRVGELRRFL
jgi:hypothetical protein